MEELSDYISKWSSETVTLDTINVIKSNLGLSDESTLNEIDEKFNIEFDNLFDLRKSLIYEGLINNPNNIQSLENEKDLNKILEIVHYTRNTIQALYLTNVVSKQNHSFNPELDTTLYKYQALITEELKPQQEMILYILQTFSDKKYKRYNNCCYESIKTDEGYDTLAWKKVDTIENCVYRCFNKSVNLNMFLTLTKTKDGARSIIHHMEKSFDNHFPILQKDRHVFSFKNGIYVSKVWNPETNWWTDKFYKYTDSDFPSHLTSCKYFDVQMTCFDEKNPENIQTPLLDSIFKYQNLDDDVIIWNKVYLGRLLYEVEELDNWQTIMFYLGQGGTGKSTINNHVAKQFYDDSDVAVMSNNIQTKFGLSDIYNKFLFIAPEIKRDWCIEQAEFQEIVSGGTLNINIKFKQSEVIDWKAPGILGGNENPDFIDNSGSIKRRIIVTRFDKKVTKSDTRLGQKLKKELPNIIKQCNMYYQDYARKYCNEDCSDIWSQLPKYFIETQQLMNEATNSLANFMNSGELKFGPEEYIPESMFKKLYNDHCKVNNIKAGRWNPDFYLSHFNQYNIEIEQKATKEYRGTIRRKETFYLGVDIEESDSEEDDLFN